MATINEMTIEEMHNLFSLVRDWGSLKKAVEEIEKQYLFTRQYSWRLRQLAEKVEMKAEAAHNRYNRLHRLYHDLLKITESEYRGWVRQSAFDRLVKSGVRIQVFPRSETYLLSVVGQWEAVHEAALAECPVAQTMDIDVWRKMVQFTEPPPERLLSKLKDLQRIFNKLDK